MAAQKGGNLGVLIGLIMSVFIIVILVFITYQLGTQVEEAEQQAAQAARQQEEEVERRAQAIQRTQRLTELIWGSRQDDVDVETMVSRVRQEMLRPARERLQAILEQEQYGSEDFARRLHEEGRLEDKEYRSLRELYSDLFAQIDATVPELNRLRAEADRAREEVRQARDSARRERQDLTAQVEQLRQRAATLENQQIEAAQEWDSERRRLLDEKDVVQQEMEQLREESFIAEARLASEVSILEERITQMTEKQRRTLADTDVDGEVVHANHRLGMAWIDIGRNDRLRRGLTFEVFQYIKGGERKRKGMIEVQRVEEDTAQVAILEQYDVADPIIKGDYISSPFYNRDRDMVFVFVGDRLTTDRYERSQLVRRVEEFGGRVDDEVTIETDFVVAIRNAEQSDEFTKAVQFGVVIMREEELLDFLGQ